MKASLLVLLMIAYSTWSCCNGGKKNHGHAKDKKNKKNVELLSSSGNNYTRSIFPVDNGDSSQTGFSPRFSCVVAQLHFVSNNLTWADAQSYCRANYTDLVTINKEDETPAYISGKQEFWIGLKRYNDNWQWSNNDEVAYSKWKRDFFCAFVQSDGSWNDTVCYKNFTFMCYKETNNISERYFWINESVMWSRAQNYCQVNYKDLVSIRNESENEEIKNKSQGTPFWIGLFNSPWKWSDGGNSTFRNWSVGNPDNYNHNEKCAEINYQENGRSGWNDADCNLQKSFFCNSSCGNSSQQYVSYKLTWSDAVNYCKVNCSGTLITVENEAMNSNWSNRYSNSWIGLRHEYDNWHWSNSDPVTYTNWKRTFSCAVLQSDGSWNDSDCNALNPFLCYNETDNSNGRFFWINISMTWSSAQNYCQVNYTDLASIRNESENNAAMEKIQNITSWIGLFNNPWKWSDGQDFTFQNWTLQQANIYQNNETCVKATSNGDWKAIDCSTKEPFICSNTVMNATFINKNLTWEEALDYCRKNNSDLISISSQVEQDAIAALVNTANSTSVWLGLRQSRMFGFWFWIDEKPLSYEQWVNGSPSQLPASSPCAVMSQANNFNWINVSCSETYSFICRYK